MTFADGHPITAEDVCFTVDAMLSVDNPVPWAQAHREVIAGCDVGDARHARVRFAGPVASPKSWLAIPILPAHVFDGNPVIPVDHPFRDKAFGTLGMRGTRTDKRVVFEDVDGGERPFIKRFELVPMPPVDKALANLRAGKVHGIVELPWSEVTSLYEEDDIAVRHYDLRQIWFVSLDIDDARVREALDLSIDRLALRAQLFSVSPDDPYGSVEPVSGPFVMSSPFYNRARPVVKADLARAASLRAEAGFDRPLRVGAAPGLPADVVEALSSQLEAAGWQVETGGTELDLRLGRYSHDQTDDVGSWFAAEGPHNPFGWRDSRVDALVSKTRFGNDTTAQDAAHELHALLAEERPVLFLWAMSEKTAWRNEVRGNIIDPSRYWSAFGDWKLTR